jgi:hypothetical protein
MKEVVGCLSDSGTVGAQHISLTAVLTINFFTRMSLLVGTSSRLNVSLCQVHLAPCLDHTCTAPMAAPNDLCIAAIEAMKSVGNLADCWLMADDGSGHKVVVVKVSKAIMAAHSKVLGCESSALCLHACYNALHVDTWAAGS